MKTTCKLLLSLFFFFSSMGSKAEEIQYSKRDSIKITQLLKAGCRQDSSVNLILFYARKLKGIPYVAQTLEKNTTEKLVVNLQQLDCTTYVENVMALYLCTKNGLVRFEDFTTYLRLLRYEGGKVAYQRRLHYFSNWVADNHLMGYVEEIQAPNPPFTAVQTLEINYMSRHPGRYPMLVAHPQWVKDIAAMENELNGKTFRYIPKGEIANTPIFRETIKDGDIIAILTNKSGLDTSHIGIAVWHPDGLHLLNASQIRHQVVEEPMTLYHYMQRHPTQTGIRIIRPTR